LDIVLDITVIEWKEGSGEWKEGSERMGEKQLWKMNESQIATGLKN